MRVGSARSAAEDNSCSVGRPIGVPLFWRSSGISSRGVPPSVETVYSFQFLSGQRARESDLLAIGRPGGKLGCKRRVGELESLAAVQFALPECSLRVADIGHPLSIFREADVIRRNSGKEWNELCGLRIVANHLPARQCSHHEQLLAILAGQRRGESHRPGGQLQGLAVGFSK